jgi:hypothetical protein
MTLKARDKNSRGAVVHESRRDRKEKTQREEGRRDWSYLAWLILNHKVQ